MKNKLLEFSEDEKNQLLDELIKDQIENRNITKQALINKIEGFGTDSVDQDIDEWSKI